MSFASSQLSRIATAGGGGGGRSDTIRTFITDPVNLFGGNEQAKMNQQAKDLKAQQAADAATAAQGPQAMALRTADAGTSYDAAGVTGNNGGLGSSLLRRGAARRSLVSG